MRIALSKRACSVGGEPGGASAELVEAPGKGMVAFISHRSLLWMVLWLRRPCKGAASECSQAGVNNQLGTIPSTAATGMLNDWTALEHSGKKETKRSGVPGSSKKQWVL